MPLCEICYRIRSDVKLADFGTSLDPLVLNSCNECEIEIYKEMQEDWERKRKKEQEVLGEIIK